MDHLHICLSSQIQILILGLKWELHNLGGLCVLEYVHRFWRCKHKLLSSDPLATSLPHMQNPTWGFSTRQQMALRAMYHFWLISDILETYGSSKRKQQAQLLKGRMEGFCGSNILVEMTKSKHRDYELWIIALCWATGEWWEEVLKAQIADSFEDTRLWGVNYEYGFAWVKLSLNSTYMVIRLNVDVRQVCTNRSKGRFP